MSAGSDRKVASRQLRPIANILRFLRVVAPSEREFLGIPHLRVGYVRFVVYAGLVVAAIRREPAVAGAAMVLAAIIDTSETLGPGSENLVLSSWRRGLDVRMQWRSLLFIAALAVSSVDSELIAAYAAAAFGAGVGVRIMRSDNLQLETPLRVQPMGSMAAHAGSLPSAIRASRLRDHSELWLQGSALAGGAVLTLPSVSSLSNHWAEVAALALIGVALTAAAVIALACRRLRPEMLLRHDDAVIAAFLEYDPEVICYFNGHPGSTYAVDAWLRTFEECGRRVALVYRHKSVRRVDTSVLPAITVPSDSMIERVVTPSTRVALYPANGTLNVHLQRDKRLSHVFIGHGDSDKTGSASPLTKSYDQIWVSGQAGIDRYRDHGVDIPRNRFVVIGRPPLSPRVRAAESAHSAELAVEVGLIPPLTRLAAELEQHPAPAPPVTILYAPTWEGYFDDSDYSSVATMGLDLVAACLEAFPEARVIFKPHPLNGHRKKASSLAASSIRRLLEDAPGHHPSTQSHSGVLLYEWFELADILITDVSSVITDFLMWDRPIVVTAPPGMAPDEVRSRFPSTRGTNVIDAGTDIVEVLRNAHANDPDGPRRRTARTYLLGEPEHDPLDLFVDALDALYTSGPHSA